MFYRNIQRRGTKELHSEFCTKVEEWIPVREETTQKIEQIIEDLKVHHRNVNISRITGSATSIAGSAMAITGFALAPVTFGASIGLSVGGVALAVAGDSTATGASIADIVIQKSNVKQAQERLREDYDQLHTIQVIAKVINRSDSTDARKECPGVGKKKHIAVCGEAFTQGFIRASNVGVRAAEMAAFNTLEIGAAALRVGSTAAKGIAAAGIALNVVLIPIDLVEIVRSSISLAKGSQTKAMTQLKEIVTQLKQQKQDMDTVLNELRQATAQQVQEQTDTVEEEAREQAHNVEAMELRPPTAEQGTVEGEQAGITTEDR